MHFSKHWADSLPAQKSRQTLHSSSDISSKYHVHKHGFARFLLRFGVHIPSPSVVIFWRMWVLQGPAQYTFWSLWNCFLPCYPMCLKPYTPLFLESSFPESSLETHPDSVLSALITIIFVCPQVSLPFICKVCFFHYISGSWEQGPYHLFFLSLHIVYYIGLSWNNSANVIVKTLDCFSWPVECQ